MVAAMVARKGVRKAGLKAAEKVAPMVYTSVEKLVEREDASMAVLKVSLRVPVQDDEKDDLSAA